MSPSPRRISRHYLPLLPLAAAIACGDGSLGATAGATDSAGTTDGATGGTTASGSSDGSVSGGSGSTSAGGSGGSTSGSSTGGSEGTTAGSSGGQVGCGNGVVEGDETCDDAGAGACSPECHRAVVQVTGGLGHTCALLADATVRCWGVGVWAGQGISDTEHYLGDAPGEMGDALPPLDLGPSPAILLSGAASSTCALLENGTVKCWGSSSNGQLGLESFEDYGDQPGEMGTALPAVPLGTMVTPTGLGAGYFERCATFTGGGVKCWGSGALGLEDSSSRGNLPGDMGDALPFVDLGAGVQATMISASYYLVCAALVGGDVKCWGAGDSGQLGQGDLLWRGFASGTMGDALAPIDLGPGAEVTQVAATQSAACALLSDGRVKCWGSGSFGFGGEVPAGSTTAHRGDEPGEMGAALPYIDLGSNVVVTALVAQSGAAFALTSDGRVKSWGSGNAPLGHGDLESRGDQPGEMGDALPYIDLGTGRTVVAVEAHHGAHACAVLNGGSLKCWGHNDAGQLGLGDQEARGDEPGEMGDALPVVPL